MGIVPATALVIRIVFALELPGFQAPQTVDHLAWCHSESGCLLAGGMSSGSVLIWEAPRGASGRRQDGGSDEDMGDGSEDMEWRQAAEIKCSKYPVK